MKKIDKVLKLIKDSITNSKDEKNLINNENTEISVREGRSYCFKKEGKEYKLVLWDITDKKF